jgi:hypothetical protein
VRTGLVMAMLSALWLASQAGCGGAKVKTHPVQGKVELKGGDVAILQGSHVELLAQEGEAEKRASGVIAADGTFSLKTLHEGEVVAGAPEGQYKARIILGDESDENVPKRKGNPVHRRFLDFETSGLSVTVPAGDYTISLSSK